MVAQCCCLHDYQVPPYIQQCSVDMLQDCSALGLAVWEGHVDVAQSLLLAGANVNAKGPKCHVHVRQLLLLSFPQACHFAVAQSTLQLLRSPNEQEALSYLHAMSEGCWS